MVRATSVFVLSFLALAIIACGGNDAGKADSAGAVAAAPATTGSGSSGDDLAEVTSYTLSMDKVNRLMNVQRNIGKRVMAMTPEQRRAAGEGMNMGANDDTDAMVRKIEQNPVLVAAVREAGMSPREYIVATVAMMQAGMAAGVIGMHQNPNVDSLAREMKANPANVRFVMENKDALDKMQKTMEAEAKQFEKTMSGSGGDDQ